MVKKGVIDWLSEKYQDILDDDELRRAFKGFAFSLVSLYISYKVTQRLAESMHDPNRRKNMLRAHQILKRIGLTVPQIRKFLRITNSHELMVLQNLVTDMNQLDTMDNIMGLKKEKAIIERNLTFALQLHKTKQFNKIINVTPGMLLHGHWFIIFL